jgi:hypothetical protein
MEVSCRLHATAALILVLRSEGIAPLVLTSVLDGGEL